VRPEGLGKFKNSPHRESNYDKCKEVNIYIISNFAQLYTINHYNYIRVRKCFKSESATNASCNVYILLGKYCPQVHHRPSDFHGSVVVMAICYKSES
jgi:hypothetical protein